MQLNSKGSVVLATYSRVQLFKNCMESIYNAHASNSIQKIIVSQGAFNKSLPILRKHLDHKTTLLKLEGVYETPLKNMMHNYFLSLQLALDEYQR